MHTQFSNFYLKKKTVDKLKLQRANGNGGGADFEMTRGGDFERYKEKGRKR